MHNQVYKLPRIVAKKSIKVIAQANMVQTNDYLRECCGNIIHDHHLTREGKINPQAHFKTFSSPNR